MTQPCAIAQETPGAGMAHAPPPGNLPLRHGPTACSGFTLVEMLVVLVLVSLLSTLLIQGVGFFLGNYSAVKRAHRDASLAALRQHWFISTVQAIVPSALETRQFVGDNSWFEGVTLQALTSESGIPVRARWAITDGDGSNDVAYSEEGGSPLTVLTSHREAFEFQYEDAAGRWHDRWPLESDNPKPPRERIPRKVRLVSQAGRTVWLARLELFPEPVRNYREEW